MALHIAQCSVQGCTLTDPIVARACMHGVHSTCSPKECPACGSDTATMKATMRKLHLVQSLPDVFDHLPLTSVAVGEDAVYSRFTDNASSFQLERNGTWVVLLCHSIVFMVCVKDGHAIRWSGTVSLGDKAQLVDMAADCSPDCPDDLFKKADEMCREVLEMAFVNHTP